MTVVGRSLQNDHSVPAITKPADICVRLSDAEAGLLKLERCTCIERFKADIVASIRSEGLELRHAGVDDILPLESFIATCFRAELISEISPYDLYRFIAYGHGLILENEHAEIRGCLFEIGYDTPERLSYTIRLGVDSGVQNRGLGRLLTVYSCLLACERGSRLKRAIVDYDNHQQIYTLLNKVGFVFDGFHPDLPGVGSVYTAALSLTPAALLTNRIDDDRITAFIRAHREGEEYRLCEPDDRDAVAALYAETPLRVAAFIRAGLIDERAALLALPKHLLGLE